MREERRYWEGRGEGMIGREGRRDDWKMRRTEEKKSIV